MSKSLAKQLKNYIDNLPPNSPKTIDDFYKSLNIRPEDVIDYSTAAVFQEYFILSMKNKQKNSQNK